MQAERSSETRAVRIAALVWHPMAFWNKTRANRADRAVGARGRAPSLEKQYKQRLKANYEAQRARENEQRHALQSASDAALRRLEAHGFPGAVRIADPKRKIRAAWYLCDALADGPQGETTVSRYYLFSTGEVADDRGRSVTAARSQDEIVAALNRLA